MKQLQNNIVYIALFFLMSCHSYRQNIMLKTKKGASYLSEKVDNTEKNYVITPDDYLELKVYTNNGELIIDPNMELTKNLGVVMNSSTMNREKPKYLVRVDGTVDLPMLGDIDVNGKTIYETKKLLDSLYSGYYETPFVYLKLVNKRVILINGEIGTVVPLENENMTVFEVIALGGGVSNKTKAFNVRIIRGDLSNPEVYLLDLSTVEGMMRANTRVEPNDIVYLEPVRKIITESLSDIMPILALFSSLITLALVLNQSKR